MPGITAFTVLQICAEIETDWLMTKNKNKMVAVPDQTHCLTLATCNIFFKDETEAQRKNMQWCFGNLAKFTASTN
jgi:hypothetical protein